MLKGIVNDVPKDIIRIPMKGKNLWDPDSRTTDQAGQSAWGVVLPAGTYTIKNSSNVSVYKRDGYDSTQASTFAAAGATATYTFVVGCVVWGDSRQTGIMLNLGSTALPYEPYGMQNGWEVRDQQGTILWGADKTLTGTDSISFKGYGLPLKSWTVQGNEQQTGTPTPSAPIMPQETGDRTGNLWDEDYTGISESAKYVPVKVGNGDFTLSSTVSRSGTAAVLFLLAGNVLSGISSDTNGVWDGQSRTVTAADGYVTVAYRAYASSNPADSSTMLNSGQTALPYEPYGYKLPLTLGTTQNIYLSEPIRKIGDYVDVASATGTSGMATRQICKLVLTGEENIEPKSGNARWYIPISGMKRPKSAAAVEWVCSHYQAVSNAATWANYDYMISWSTSDDGIAMGLRIRDIDYLTGATVTDFKAYLAAQYSNGTPVTIWYVLATATTETFTAPILTPANGNNTLTVDTTLPPSKTIIKVHAKPVHYGFKIDKTNDNSDIAVTYTHDAVTMTPAAMNFSTGVFSYGSWENVWFVKDAYPVALNLNGTEAYRLDPDDYTKKSDGTPSDIQYVLLAEEPADWSTQWKQYYHKTGDVYELNDQAEAPAFATDTYYQLTSGTFAGNFMVAFPKVYFKRTEDATYNYVEISNVKLSDDWHAYAHINANGDEVDNIYLPMFKGSIVSSKLRSIPGKTPQGGTTADQEVTAASACGSRWQIWDHSSRELINDLLILMCKSIDSQGKFGKGRESGYNANDTVTYGKLQTGTLVSKGKFYGYSSSYKDVKVFGIEGFWANRFDRIQGLLLVNNVWKVKMTPSYDFTGTNFQTLSTASVPDGNGYLSKTQTSQYGSIPASVSGGSSSKYYKDYFYKTATGTRGAVVGGYCGSGVNCGFRYVYVSYTASYSSWNIGASPVYK